MARHQHQREDLLRDAVALVERAEFRFPAVPEPVVAGFRSDGCFSVFFGEDPVYQFNSSGALRRAYVADELIKAEGGMLVALRRQPAAGRIELLRRQLNPDEQAALLSQVEADLRRLTSSLEPEQEVRVKQIPDDVDVRGRILAWLRSCRLPMEVAQKPQAT